MDRNEKKVLIAVPTFETIYPDTFKSIYELEIPEGMTTEFAFVRGYDCATARNNIVTRAQEAKADYVLMVDNDTILPKDALRHLSEGGRDVVLGYYAHRNNANRYGGKVNWCKLGEFNYTDQFTGAEIRELEAKGETRVQIHGGGMGCAFIKMSVFDRLSYPWYDWINYADENRGMLSEDLLFCEKCKHKKIPIYGDTRVPCGHIFRYIQNPD